MLPPETKELPPETLLLEAAPVGLQAANRNMAETASINTIIVFFIIVNTSKIFYCVSNELCVLYVLVRMYDNARTANLSNQKRQFVVKFMKRSQL